MNPAPDRIVAWFAALSLCAVPAVPMPVFGQPADHSIELRERLNLDWTAEWIVEPFSAPAGACHPESVTLTGADGPVPAQLIEIETWPETPFVRQAKLIYVTDLAALETRRFTLRYGPDPAPRPASDLRVAAADDRIEMTNDRFGLRLLLGEQRYEPAVAASEVPGPVYGVRLADGTWTGASRLYGPGAIRAYRARLLETGPALARAEIVYEYEDGRVLTLRAQLAARAPRAEWDMSVTPYDPEAAAQFVLGSGWAEAAAEAAQQVARDGWQWLLDPGFPDLTLAVQMNPNPDRNRWGEIRRGRRAAGGRYNYEGLDLTPHLVNLREEPAGELALWMPWAAFHQTRQTILTFTTPNDTETRAARLQFAVLDPGAWVEPAAPGTWASYMNIRTRHKSVPLMRGEDGSVFLQFNASSGHRHWQVGIPEPLTPEDRWREGYHLHGVARRLDTRQATWSLNTAKDLILDWPAEDRLPPLRPAAVTDVDADDLAYKLQRGAHWSFAGLSYRDAAALDAYRMSGRDPGVAQTLRLVRRLEYFLSAFGNLDRWRYGTRELLPQLYDEVMRSGLGNEAQRRLFRAQFAFLGYVMNNPGDWSPERGWASGNLNMTIYNVKTLTHIASRIPDHPLAPIWSAPAAVWVESMLNAHVGPHGEFVGAGESLTHYAWGSAGAILSNAVLARSAGGRDLVTDPRMVGMMTFLAKIVTPPDPRPHAFHPMPRSVTPPVGRGTVYNAPTHYDTFAREIASTDPELAADLWWAWQRANPGARAEMPYRTPDWTSEWFPETGVILRHGLDTAYEHYAFFVLENQRVAYASEQGVFAAIWAFGVPVATRFGGRGYEEREEILASRVLPAWNPGDREQRYPRFEHEGPRQIRDTAFLPRQDYLRAELLLRETSAKHHGGVAREMPAWPVLDREAELPIQWQRQVLFVKGPGAGDVNYYVFRDTIGGDQPTRWQYWTISEKIGTPDEVENRHAFLADRPGNRQQDARTLEGNRFTAVGQHGVDVEYFIASPAETPRHTLRWGLEHAHYTEYQDLLHLQMPGDGAYFVALFPRRHNASAPVFAVQGEGHVIRVHGDHGTDHVFLSAEEVEAEADGIRFRGTAASVQDRRAGGQVLSLGEAGEIRLSNGVRLASADAVSLQTGAVMTVTVPSEPARRRVVTLSVPGTLVPVNPPAGVELTTTEDAYRLALPQGVRQVLVRREDAVP